MFYLGDAISTDSVFAFSRTPCHLLDDTRNRLPDWFDSTFASGLLQLSGEPSRAARFCHQRRSQYHPDGNHSSLALTTGWFLMAMDTELVATDLHEYDALLAFDSLATGLTNRSQAMRLVERLKKINPGNAERLLMKMQGK